MFRMPNFTGNPTRTRSSRSRHGIQRRFERLESRQLLSADGLSAHAENSAWTTTWGELPNGYVIEQAETNHDAADESKNDLVITKVTAIPDAVAVDEVIRVEDQSSAKIPGLNISIDDVASSAEPTSAVHVPHVGNGSDVISFIIIQAGGASQASGYDTEILSMNLSDIAPPRGLGIGTNDTFEGPIADDPGNDIIVFIIQANSAALGNGAQTEIVALDLVDTIAPPRGVIIASGSSLGNADGEDLVPYPRLHESLHPDWIIIETMSSSAERALAASGSHNETVLGDVVVVRQLDSSGVDDALSAGSQHDFAYGTLKFGVNVSGPWE